MKRVIFAAVLTMLLAPSVAPAQYYQYVYRNTPYGKAYAYRQQYGNFVVGAQGFQPYNNGFPYWQNVYAGFPYSNYNASNYPFLGYPTYQFPVYQQAPPIIIQQPIVIQQGQPAANNFVPPNFPRNNGGFGNGIAGLNGNPVMPARFGDGMGIPADVRLPVKPEVKPAVPKVGPAAKPADPAPAPAPKLEMPKAADKLAGAELARKAVESGRTAFASGEFGRALELFRKAVTQNPDDANNYYLLSQAQFAVGKYREAVASISAGMTLKADWSNAKFEPRKLYGKQEQVFDEHLTQLRTTMIDHPNDASLSFLLGHQLWVDGKKDEAKTHLQKAKDGPRGSSPAEMFVMP